MEHYFDDSSLLRQVVGHRLTGMSGPRALLVMAAHPVAFAGFSPTPARSTTRTRACSARRT